MEHYVTLFDSLFLPQGLALHMSMEKNAGDYTLWVLCVDDETYDVLTTIGLPNVRLLQLSCLELDELKMIKGNRTLREYCWTLTPFAPRFVFEAETSVSRVTYVDADMWFRKNPEPILREFNISKKNVGLKKTFSFNRYLHGKIYRCYWDNSHSRTCFFMV